jgi:hypothetical protein
MVRIVAFCLFFALQMYSEGGVLRISCSILHTQKNIRTKLKLSFYTVLQSRILDGVGAAMQCGSATGPNVQHGEIFKKPTRTITVPFFSLHIYINFSPKDQGKNIFFVLKIL